MNPAIIILILVVAPVVLGAGLKWIKAYMEEQEQLARRNRQRSGTPVAASAPAPKGGTSDIDRFLQEIDKLRKREGGLPSPPPTPKPTVAKVAVAKAKPVAKERATEPAYNSPPPPAPKSEEASTKAYASTPPMTSMAAFTPPPSPILDSKIGAKAKPTPKTQFARNLVDLLSNKQSVPLAVVLQEVLGPPKSRS
jgi:hypothetical protein